MSNHAQTYQQVQPQLIYYLSKDEHAIFKWENDYPSWAGGHLQGLYTQVKYEAQLLVQILGFCHQSKK